jgi:antitoxin component of RelBE/YafQ-DinJ toxin-antitoxin module
MKDAQLTIRINSELKQKAQEHAESTGRTLAGLIEWLLKREIETNKSN